MSRGLCELRRQQFSLDRRGVREGLAENEMLEVGLDYIGNFSYGKEREGRTSWWREQLGKGMGVKFPMY